MGNRNPELDRMLTEMEKAHWGFQMRPLIHESMMLLDEIVETADNSVTDKAKDVEELAKTITGKVGISDNVIGTATTWSSEKINAENSALADSYTPQTASGETHELVTAKGGIKLDKVVGKTHKSKNWFKPTLKTATTVNGITITPLGDGTFNLNGTASADMNVVLGTDSNLVVGKSYKFLGVKGSSNTTYRMGWSGVAYIYDSGLIGTKEDTERAIRIYVLSGYTCNNLIVKPMIVDAVLYPNATYDDFEPYGLFSSGEHGFFDGEWVQGYYTATAFTVNANGISTKPIPCKGGDVVNVTASGSATSYVIAQLDDNNAIVTRSSADFTNNFSVTMRSGATKLVIGFIRTGGLSPSEAPNITVTINGQYAEVIKEHNGNVSDLVNASFANAIVGANINSINVNATNRIVSRVLPSGTYTISADDSNVEIYYAKATNGIITSVGGWISAMPYTIVSTEDIRFMFRYKVGNIDASAKISIAKGTDAIPFVKHEENTIFLPLTEPLYGGNYIDEEGLHVNYVAVDFENADLSKISRQTTSSSGIYRFVYSGTSGKNAGNDSIPNVISDKFNHCSVNDIWNLKVTNGVSVASSNGALIFYSDETKEMSLDDFRTWIKNNKVKVVYELATPTLIPLTPSQAKAMASLVSYEGKTYIDTADVYAKATLDVTYGKTDIVAMTIENGNKADYNRALIESEIVNLQAMVLELETTI